MHGRCPTLLRPKRHRAVLFDQRAAGRSRPHAREPNVDWASIDLQHHVADIEALRLRLAIDRWAVFGISWGSMLAVAYAQRQPERVSAVVAAAVSTGTVDDIDWLTVGAGRFFPAEWEALGTSCRNDRATAGSSTPTTSS